MRYTHVFIATIVSLLLSSCANLDCRPYKGSVLEGSNNAPVGLYIDKNGYPQATVQDVTVAPGQRIVFIGPDQFEIIFKDRRSPVEDVELRSSKGILVLDIPKDVFAREDRKNPENRTKNELIYRYSIRANGNVTDPTIRIYPR